MNELSPHEQLLLGRARRAFSPNAEDQSRVLSALLPAVGVASLAPPSTPVVGSGRLLRLFSGVVAIGVAGVVGYGWGYRAGSERAVPAVAGAVVVKAPPAVSAPSPSPSVVDEPEPSGALRHVTPSAPHREAAIPATSASSSSMPGLDEEVRQLRRIERAVREGNPRLALVIAEDLDRAIPRGQLLLERRAARTMASCQVGSDGARQAAERFIAENPSAAYVGRLREICGRSPQNAANAGTHGAQR